MKKIVTLTTDFGFGSYVGQMKGVILSSYSEVVIVDIDHQIPAQDILAGGIVLADSVPYFPSGTIHIAVVDPGVGSDRSMVYAEIGEWTFLAPDNGILTQVAARYGVQRIVKLTQPKWWRSEVSSTFHGRDIFSSVAGHLLRGTDPGELGEPTELLILYEGGEPTSIAGGWQGKVVWVDSFGNCVTNLGREHLLGDQYPRLRARVAAEIQGRTLEFLEVQTYSNASKGDAVWLIGSSGRLELAIVQGDAHQQLGLHPGDVVRLSTSPFKTKASTEA